MTKQIQVSRSRADRSTVQLVSLHVQESEANNRQGLHFPGWHGVVRGHRQILSAESSAKNNAGEQGQKCGGKHFHSHGWNRGHSFLHERRTLSTEEAEAPVCVPHAERLEPHTPATAPQAGRTQASRLVPGGAREACRNGHCRW